MLLFLTQLGYFLQAKPVNPHNVRQWEEVLGAIGFPSQGKYQRINYDLPSFPEIANHLPCGFLSYLGFSS